MAKRDTTSVGGDGSAVKRQKQPKGKGYASFDEESSLPAANESALASQASSKPLEQSSKANMQQVFGPGGLLERCMIGGYEHRRAQLEMAELVQDAFETKHHVVVEAGTGTGKTLAYLLPARHLS